MAVAVERPPISFARDARGLTLEELVGEARDAYVAELHIPLTVTQPPAPLERQADGAMLRGKAENTEVGRPLSSQLLTRIQHPEGFGNVFPIARAIDDLRGWCRGKHLEGRRGPWSDHVLDVAAGPSAWGHLARYRPLCARLAYYVVVHRVPLDRLARQEQLGPIRTRELLLVALRHAWDQRREWAYADTSGVAQVLRQRRQERAAARERALASRAGDVACRRCGSPFDADSSEPCPAGMDAVLSTVLDARPLCEPER